jgi:hypothetical protein
VEVVDIVKASVASAVSIHGEFGVDAHVSDANGYEGPAIRLFRSDGGV